MAVRRIDGWWYVDFRAHRVRLRKRSPHNSKGGAEAYEDLLRREIARYGNLDRLDAKKQAEAASQELTFVEFAERWMRDYVAVNNKPSEQNQKRSTLHAHLVPVFGGHRLRAIGAEMIERYKAAKLSSGLVPKTVNNHLAVLRKCLHTAVEWDLLATAPSIRLLKAPPSRFDHLSPAETDVLISATPSGTWRTMVLVAVRAGLRVSEILGLEWDDIDLERDILVVQRADVRRHIGTPKNNRVRRLPLAADLATALRELPRTSTRIFVIDGRPLSYNTAYEQLHKFCERAGLRPIGWHTLRHSFASQLSASGAPLGALKELMGHSTIDMTLRYAHMAPGVMRSVIDLLHSRGVPSWAAGGHPGPVLPSPALASQGSDLRSTQQKTPASADAL